VRTQQEEPGGGEPFDGQTYDPEVDRERLGRQLASVRDEMLRASAWLTLQQIAIRVNEPPASVSARLRDLRKEKFGGFAVLRCRRGDDDAWRYAVFTCEQIDQILEGRKPTRGQQRLL
jgi:hypothetical protein